MIREWYNPGKHADWDVTGKCGEDVKLERSPGWNLVRAERPKLSIFAYVENQKRPKVSELKTSTNSIDNTHELHRNCTSAAWSLRRVDEFTRSDVTVEWNSSTASRGGTGSTTPPAYGLDKPRSTTRDPSCSSTPALKSRPWTPTFLVMSDVS
ncbi:unnamed protein product [Phytophthora fragariaefolia]|uniref:Unnamed protein product n=1 Tax=Phytophthora fragariaefolia TaxID=1490495 RepID=A0A9W6XTJ9_9STRA|nr:unnamed protein product [Phytophthora fragariaefolia]